MSTPHDANRRFDPGRGIWRRASWLVVALLAAASPVSAQVTFSETAPGNIPLGQFKPAPAPVAADPKTFPRTPQGKPDFTGIWNSTFMRPPPEPLTAAYQAKAKEWERASAAGMPYATSQSRCLASGMPSMMNMLDVEFIHASKQLTIIMEDLREVRRIYLDGRTRPSDFDPAFDGYSTGRWEGDSLVVETTGLRDGDGGNGWLSSNAHVLERISMVNADALSDEIVVTDPERLTAPWKYTIFFNRAPKNTEMQEVVCENNRNAEDASGFQTAK